jgi:hypothetical protein
MKQNNTNYNRKYGENEKSHVYQFKDFRPLKSLMYSLYPTIQGI